MPVASSSSNVISSKDQDTKPQGLGDFQSRLNRGSYGEDRKGDYGRDRRDDRNRSGHGRDRDSKSWNDAPTPRSVKGEREPDGGSMRVPNRGWDETPRGRRDGWGKDGNGESSRKGGMGWDQTPRSVRGKREFDDDGEEGVILGGKEWEEEQVKLDRDWYSYDDEGAVVSGMARIHSVEDLAYSRRRMRSTTHLHNGRILRKRRKRRCKRRRSNGRRLDRLNL